MPDSRHKCGQLFALVTLDLYRQLFGMSIFTDRFVDCAMLVLDTTRGGITALANTARTMTTRFLASKDLASKRHDEGLLSNHSFVPGNGRLAKPFHIAA